MRKGRGNRLINMLLFSLFNAPVVKPNREHLREFLKSYYSEDIIYHFANNGSKII